SERNGPVVGLGLVGDAEEVIVITDRGQTLRTAAAEIRETGRNAQGVSIMRVAGGERIVAMEIFTDDNEEEEDAEEGDENAEPIDASATPTDEGRGGAQAPAPEEDSGEPPATEAD
ncbi:MAG: DNA gyrase C-terminal beta-propeller domain-containing protein, partial [Myxococcota bacterium]